MTSHDFEVHPIGTAAEMALCQNLCNVIDQVQAQYPGTVPLAILSALAQLRERSADRPPLEPKSLMAPKTFS